MGGGRGPGDPGCWPTLEQELLLDAAVGPPDQVSDAFARWCQAVGAGSEADAAVLDHLDLASLRLLSVIGANHGHLLASPWPERLLGIRRRSLMTNQLVIQGCLPAIDELQAAGLPVLALKGTALSARYYRDAGVRSMSDVDVLVPFARAEEALTTLLDAGWQPKPIEPLPSPLGQLPSAFTRRKHGTGLAGPDGYSVDLHWHALWACCWDDADEGFWSRAEPLDIQGRALLALEPTDQLIHTLVHGLKWDAVPAVWWMADAMTVLRASSIDWCAVVERAETLRVQPIVVGGLEHLRQRFGAPVPMVVLDALRRSRLPRCEQRWLASRLTDESDFGAQWGRYARTLPARTPLDRAQRFPSFLRDRWGRRHLAGVPMEVVRRAGHRLLPTEHP